MNKCNTCQGTGYTINTKLSLSMNLGTFNNNKKICVKCQGTGYLNKSE